MAIELHHLHPSHDDELSRLKARIAELEEERRWRKFPDEKPTKDIKFLVINEKAFCNAAITRQYCMNFKSLSRTGCRCRRLRRSKHD